MVMKKDSQLEVIKDYYGKVLASKNDLKTTACCSTESLPKDLKALINRIHPEVRQKFYGCGVPLPALLEGLTVLDLGSGSGRDCFALSALVGATGRVIGVDMTDEQLEVAQRYSGYHAKEFGFAQSNVDFRKGYIEDLKDADVGDASVDLVVSNCVINLSPHKQMVFDEIYRVLKPGGELYFSDVFVDRRLTQEQQSDPILLGECLGGALYGEDFRRIMSRAGFLDYRTISVTPIQMTNDEVSQKIGLANFSSITVRAFKLPLEDRCEDYGQGARYLGTIKGLPHGFRLDDHHYFETHKLMAVCANTASMLHDSRFGAHFEILGDLSRHYGLFDCSTPTLARSSVNSTGVAAACC